MVSVLDRLYTWGRGTMDYWGLQTWRLVYTSEWSWHMGSTNVGAKRISLNAIYAFYGSPAENRDTVLHEIAHALTPVTAESHGEQWKAVAQRVGATPCAGLPSVLPIGTTPVLSTCPKTCCRNLLRMPRQADWLCLQHQLPMSFIRTGATVPVVALDAVRRYGPPRASVPVTGEAVRLAMGEGSPLHGKTARIVKTGRTRATVQVDRKLYYIPLENLVRL